MIEVVVSGPAGSGKSAAVSAIKEALEAKGSKVTVVSDLVAATRPKAIRDAILSVATVEIRESKPTKAPTEPRLV